MPLPTPHSGDRDVFQNGPPRLTGAIFLALVPIVLLIGLGQAMRRATFLPDAFWPQAERLCYFVLLPALFVHGLATADLTGVPVARLALALVLATLCGGAVLVLLQCRLMVEGPAFTSLFQGGIRFNNYVGITAAVGLFGTPGVALAAVANAAIVPTVNILCVLVFAQYGSAKPTLTGVLRGIALNPLVAASFAGILLHATGIGLPPGLDSAVRALGQASLPLGLLCVGAAFELRAVRRGLGLVLLSSLAKFVMMPLATVLAGLALGLEGPAMTIAILFQALPTASSSYVMARQLGGDAPLMAGIIAFQTALAALAVPLVLLLATRAS